MSCSPGWKRWCFCCWAAFRIHCLSTPFANISCFASRSQSKLPTDVYLALINWKVQKVYQYVSSSCGSVVWEEDHPFYSPDGGRKKLETICLLRHRCVTTKRKSCKKKHNGLSWHWLGLIKVDAEPSGLLWQRHACTNSNNLLASSMKAIRFSFCLSHSLSGANLNESSIYLRCKCTGGILNKRSMTEYIV